MRDLHVVVTGASSGIGEALARAASAAGARVTLVARRRELLEKIAAELPGKYFLSAVDLGDSEHAAEFLPEAEKALGPVDVLINNAGVQIVRATPGSDPAAGEQLLKLNVFTPMRLALAVLPSMLERKRGTIVNVASLAGLMPTPSMFYYNASKGGLGAASEGLRGELRKTGVNVVTVYPGPVVTPMERAAREKLQMTATADRVPTGNVETLAKLVFRAVEKRRARVIYPRFYALVRHFPNLARWITDAFTPPAKT